MKPMFRLVHATARQLAASWCMEAPDGWVVTFRPPTRSLEQNAKLHAMLSEVADQVVWYGQKLVADDWKRIFAAALTKVRVVPGIDPGSFVPVGLRTSDMTIGEMNDMIELIYAFGAEHGVTFHERALEPTRR